MQSDFSEVCCTDLKDLHSLRQTYLKILESLQKDQLDSLDIAVNRVALSKMFECYDRLIQNGVTKIPEDFANSVCDLKLVGMRKFLLRMESMINEVGNNLGKGIRYTVTGEILILQSQAQLIQECILHLVRNSCDHGIETRETRAKRNKSAIGLIAVVLTTDMEKKTHSIVISDDGAGIDTAKVVEVAIRKNLMDAPQVMRLSDHEKNALIFLPGFSTQATATQISGRGVGMDVVKKNVQALKGTVEIDNRPGFGVSFSILMPAGDHTSNSL